MILTGDIGGTKTKLALFSFEDKQYKIIDQARYASKSISSLEQVVGDYLKKNNLWHSSEIKAAWFSLAGPISGNHCKMTNLNLTIDLLSLQNELAFIPKIGWSNDLVAMGYSINILPDDALMLLSTQKNRADHIGKEQNRAVLAPGTGLGESLIIGNEVYPSEGAHTDFAPNNEEDLELWQYLHKQYGHVSYERILSGAGLTNIYQFLRTKNNAEYLPDYLVPEDISAKGLAGTCSVCIEALHTFVRILGAEAGNLALKYLALGGVYVGGGIPPKIKIKLTDGTFMKAFSEKGRFGKLLDEIQVYVILEENAPLLGAAYLALKL
jgi:glucokinase